MRRHYKMIAVIIACAVLLLGSNMIAAQEDGLSKPMESSEQQSPVLDVQKSPDDISEGRRGISSRRKAGRNAH